MGRILSLLLLAMLFESCVSNAQYQLLEQENINNKNKITQLQQEINIYQQKLKHAEWQYIRDERLYTIDANGHGKYSATGALYVKTLNANAFYEMRLMGQINTILRIPIYENQDYSEYADKECNRRFKYESKTGYYLNIN